MMIRSPLGVYWSDTHEVQVGLDPRVALRLRGLSTAEQRVVSSLTSASTESEFFAACELHGVSEVRARSLLGALRDAGLLEVAPPAFPDLAWRAVFVERLDPLAVEICMHLAASGLGYILTPDTSRPHSGDHPIFRRPTWRTFARQQVLQSYFRERGWGTTVIEVDAQAQPVTPLGMGRAAGHGSFAAGAAGRGTRASTGAARAAGSTGRDARAAAGTTLRGNYSASWAAGTPTAVECGPPALALVTSVHLPDPQRCALWERQRIPYLLAYAEDIDIRVGPVVVPGNGPCARCLLFAAMDADPAWRYLAPQVFSSRGGAPFSPAVSLAAALAVHGALLVLSGHAERARGSQWVVPPLPGFPYRVTLAPHESCSCEAEPAGP
ncbi:hypothetical protein [Actinotignum timonense]|uniref:hypothetical protein n=1 Tax=Actinotignum timonense TaxID=1870995 RepID=UPI00254B1554|nr:hypothetical protein [Actinotignum timonense]MDK6630232.1 hypothetical protein [Actinotignum timonense]